MAGYSVKVTDSAERDLGDIVDYLLVKSEGPSAASGVVDAFAGVVEKLGTFPFSYPAVRDELLASIGYRWAPVAGYMAFYAVDEGNRTVTIERVLHGRQNWRAIIGDD